MRRHEKREVIQCTWFTCTMLMVHFKLHVLIHIILLKINDDINMLIKKIVKYTSNALFSAVFNVSVFKDF